jgi:hypothetical protein
MRYVPQEVAMSYWQAYKKVATTNLVVAGVVLIAAVIAAFINPQIRNDIKRRMR